MNKGDLVRCTYKTGSYIGEIVDARPEGKTAVVKILAVTKHPLQGDLHNPRQADVPLFHERRALSYTEKANIPVSHIKQFEGELPAYGESLDQAVSAYEQDLADQESEYAAASRQALQRVKESYVFDQ